MTRLPDFEAWAIFAKVAEAGSFARAAEDLGLAQATVSKAISRLEQHLQIALFHRTSRKMSLTESGLTALERATHIVNEGEALESDVAAQSVSPRGRIRLALPMSFGISHVAHLMPEFMSRYPGISLEVDFNDEQIDLISSGFDLSLRISTLLDSTLLARRLCTVKLHLVGAPRYFEIHGRPAHPRDLATHRALSYTNSRLGDAWRFTHRRSGDFSIAVPGPLRVNNAEALTPCLLGGIGIALQPEFLVWDELKAGLLEVVMPDWVSPPIALQIVTPPSRARPARVQLLIDYLSHCFAAVPWAHG